MYSKGDIVNYTLDDSDNPGIAKIELIKPKFKMLGYTCWNVKVIEVIKRSTFAGNPKVGKTETISERWFRKD